MTHNALNSVSSLLRSFSLFFQAFGSQPGILLICLVVPGFGDAPWFLRLARSIHPFIIPVPRLSISPVIMLARLMSGFRKRSTHQILP